MDDMLQRLLDRMPSDEDEARAAPRMEAMGKARRAIVATGNAGGTVPCPLCDGTVEFVAIGVRDETHVHAKCRTKGCLSWME
jgi:hypothetical protein